MRTHADSTAVLVSGGLDSAVLLGRLIRDHAKVHPLFIQTGLPWEAVERQYLDRFLNAIESPRLLPLVVLEQPVGDVYGGHWSLAGQAPGATAPDEDFYLPGRNVLLLAKALIWCRLHEVPTLQVGILKANPFPDATPDWLRNYAAVVGDAMGRQVAVLHPLAECSKADVIRQGAMLPLQHTISCMSPALGRHCGVCGKCAERGRAFIAAGVPDPTDYADRTWEGTLQRSAERRPWE